MKTDLPSCPKWVSYLASVLIVFHLGTVILIASVNHRRSNLQDSLLTFLQPYTIGLNLSHENLNAELVADDTNLDDYRISVELANSLNSGDSSWLPLVEYSGTQNSFCVDRPKQRQLLSLLQTLSKKDDSDGVLRVLKGIVVHHEASSKQQVSRVRLELSSIDSDVGISSSSLQVMDGKTCFVASVARFDDGEIGLVGAVPAHRSVPSKSKGATE